MDDKAFVINGQFSVDPVLGWVRENNSAKETRLEPRLMRLLCLLAASGNKLVTREFLTKEVWDDYGNADEGLTQAISYLRKILNDDARTLIETVPKKGYIFHGKISYSVTHKKKQRIFIILFLVILLLSAGYYLVRSHKTAQNENNSDSVQDSAKHKSGDQPIKSQSTGNPDARPDTTLKSTNADAVKK
jgi:DNA-binding winged helix-turn-helix (wHTH) protein